MSELHSAPFSGIDSTVSAISHSDTSQTTAQQELHIISQDRNSLRPSITTMPSETPGGWLSFLSRILASRSQPLESSLEPE